MNLAATGNGVHDMPSKADEIRAYALDQHVRSWRRSGDKRLSIRTGDVVRGMRLHNATPHDATPNVPSKFVTLSIMPARGRPANADGLNLQQLWGILTGREGSPHGKS